MMLMSQMLGLVSAVVTSSYDDRSGTSHHGNGCDSFHGTAATENRDRANHTIKFRGTEKQV